MMTVMLEPATEPLQALRRLRSTQAWILFGIADSSIILGIFLMVQHLAGDRQPFCSAVGMEFIIWGAIDAGFAISGIIYTLRTAARPMTPQAEADEFTAGEKLLRTLRFNHKLNIGYLLIAAVLLTLAMTFRNPTLLGHGVGVLLQGGFLCLFDLIYADRYARLMHVPV